MARRAPTKWIYLATSKHLFTHVVASSGTEAKWQAAEALSVPVTAVKVVPVRPLGAA